MAQLVEIAEYSSLTDLKAAINALTNGMIDVLAIFPKQGAIVLIYKPQ